MKVPSSVPFKGVESQAFKGSAPVASPPSTEPTSWLALCYLIDADYHPYEVRGALELSYDEFVAQVQKRLDDLCVSCKRQVVITQTWGRSIEMMQGNGYNEKS